LSVQAQMLLQGCKLKTHLMSHCCRWLALELIFTVLHVARASWTTRDGTLSVTLDVLELLPNGTIPLAAGTGRIFVEVGANSANIVDVEDLPHFPDAFLISFEPLVHHYAKLLSWHTRGGELQRLGRYNSRAVALPMAVGPEVEDADFEGKSKGGSADLFIGNDNDFCASLLRPLEGGMTGGDAKPCEPKALHARKVPLVSLKTVLDRWLAWEGGGGWPIDYLKIDAQGFDIEVLRSAGDRLPRILRVLMEVPGDTCKPMYEGSNGCSGIMTLMADMGYQVAYNRSCADFDGVCYEDDWEFVLRGIRPLHHKLLPWREECWEGLDVLDPKALCCSNLRQGAKAGCWDAMHRPSRCCAHRWLPEQVVES